MKLSKYTKLGILITFCIAVFIWGLNYLKGIDFFNKNTTYYVVYGHIDGLLESSAVTMNGYQVGQVKKINISEKNDGSLLVSFSLEGDFKIPKGTIAQIVSSDIMGTKSVKLLINQSNEYYQENDTIPGTIEEGLKEQVSMQVLPLKNKAEQLLASLDSAITVVTYVFNAETRQNLSESFEHINRTIINLEETSEHLNALLLAERENIHAILGNLNQLSATLSNSAVNFANIAENFSNISDSIADTQIKSLINDFAGSAENMKQIIEKINEGEGTAGLLINDTGLYNNLTQLSLSLDYLMKDIRSNPKRYVHFSAMDFGKDVYITTRSQSQDEKSDYSFKVHLISSPTRLDLENEVFSSFEEIEEVEISGIYNYMTGNSSNIEKIIKLHEQATNVFPDASIIAFKNNRQIKLDRALRRAAK